MIEDVHQLNNITLLLCIQKELHQCYHLLLHSRHPLQDSKLPLRNRKHVCPQQCSENSQQWLSDLKHSVQYEIELSLKVTLEELRDT